MRSGRPAKMTCKDYEEEMVLPGRIELTTSPLPRECSTTELRQRWAASENVALWVPQAPNSLPQGAKRCKRSSFPAERETFVHCAGSPIYAYEQPSKGTRRGHTAPEAAGRGAA